MSGNGLNLLDISKKKKLKILKMADHDSKRLEMVITLKMTMTIRTMMVIMITNYMGLIYDSFTCFVV